MKSFGDWIFLCSVLLETISIIYSQTGRPKKKFAFKKSLRFFMLHFYCRKSEKYQIFPHQNSPTFLCYVHSLFSTLKKMVFFGFPARRICATIFPYFHVSFSRLSHCRTLTVNATTPRGAFLIFYGSTTSCGPFTHGPGCRFFTASGKSSRLSSLFRSRLPQKSGCSIDA